jgi:hypothetical protein
VDDVVSARLAAQGLAQAPLSGDPYGAVRALLAVQAQDPVGARLTLRARTTGFGASAVDSAITTDRSLVVSWLFRGTLHLVASDDLPWLHGLTAPRLVSGTRRRLAQEGVSPEDADRGLACLRRVLSDGPAVRSELRERIREVGVRADGQALVHLLFAAVIAGEIVRGPIVGKEQAWVLAADWLGAPLTPLTPDQRDAALRELALRYLRTRAPASPEDLTKWSGLALGDVRKGLQLLGGRVRTRPDCLLDLGPTPPPAPHAPRLLGPFDEVLLSWVDRALITGEHTSIVTTNGVFRPFLLVHGRAVGTWRWQRQRVVQQPFAPLDSHVQAALDADATEVKTFLSS